MIDDTHGTFIKHPVFLGSFEDFSAHFDLSGPIFWQAEGEPFDRVMFVCLARCNQQHPYTFAQARQVMDALTHAERGQWHTHNLGRPQWRALAAAVRSSQAVNSSASTGAHHWEAVQQVQGKHTAMHS
jgi:hypothetical protein